MVRMVNARTVKWFVGELFKSDLINLFTVGHEPVVPRKVLRFKARDFRAHLLAISTIVEHRSVIKTDLIKWIAEAQRNVVRRISRHNLPKDYRICRAL